LHLCLIVPVQKNGFILAWRNSWPLPMKLGSLAFPLPETPNSSIQVMSVAVLELETEARLKTSAATPQSS
jgi:hypothetical protein